MLTNKRFIIEKYLSEDVVAINNLYYNHIKNVLRMNVKEKILLLDGKGNLFSATLEKIDKNQVLAKIRSKIHTNKNDNYVCCAYSIPKGERHSFLIEKLTEIGVKEIIPVKFHYSIDCTFNKDSNKYQRMKRIIYNAMMQSSNLYEPILHPQIDFQEVINISKNFEMKIYGNPTSCIPISCVLDKVRAINKMLCLVGPEGGLTKEEEKGLEAVGFLGVQLSNNVLRIETAAILLCGAITSYSPQYYL